MKTPTAGQVLNGAGLTLLAACFLIAAFRILSRTAQEFDSDTRVLRFAHWQLEGGIRDAFDELAREYEAIHPGVVIKQIAIPERIWKNWTTTQLVGGTPPDLIEIGLGITTSQTSRFFRPITEYVEQPNPYNRGTKLETVPWRATFHDNLESSTSMDCYGVSPFAATYRAFYNLELLRKYSGSEVPPESLTDFLNLCEAIRIQTGTEGRPIYPIAGSTYTGYILFDRMMATQTQRLAVELNPTGSFALRPEEFYLSYLKGRWSFQDPPLQDALTLIKRLGREMTPGFLSLSREDAMFYFIQGRTLMMPTGSFDITSVRSQADFPIVVGPIPSPDPDHPVYGRNMINKAAESGLRTYGSFGITTDSSQPDLALDFLRFLTSQKGNQTFARVSRWLPVIRGVEVDDEIVPFLPDRSGFPPGPGFRWGGGIETRRVTETQIHELLSDSSDPIVFAEDVGIPYARAMRRDLDTTTIRWSRNLMRDDGALGAYEFLALMRPDDLDYERRRDLVLLSQTRQEIRYQDLIRQMDQLP